MKLFTLLFSLYLLGLSFVPCGDKMECAAKSGPVISAITAHKDHNHNTEHCPPFCTCSCCSASVFFQATAIFFSSKPEFRIQNYPVYIPSYCPEVSLAIWQPPKLFKA